MPHYKDGSKAKVGDVVRGKGYNIKGKDGELKEIVGTVISITPGATSCNVQVAYIDVTELPEEFQYPDPQLFSINRGTLIVSVAVNPQQMKHYALQTNIEYGQADHFEKLGELPDLIVVGKDGKVW